MKKWIAAIAAAGVVCGLFWLGGYDFNERGEAAVIMAWIALWVAGFAYSFPWDSDR